MAQNSWSWTDTGVVGVDTPYDTPFTTPSGQDLLTNTVYLPTQGNLEWVNYMDEVKQNIGIGPGAFIIEAKQINAAGTTISDINWFGRRRVT